MSLIIHFYKYLNAISYIFVRIRMGVSILNFNAFWNLYISSFGHIFIGYRVNMEGLLSFYKRFG
jgi:hypothetical protein